MHIPRYSYMSVPSPRRVVLTVPMSDPTIRFPVMPNPAVATHPVSNWPMRSASYLTMQSVYLETLVQLRVGTVSLVNGHLTIIGYMIAYPTKEIALIYYCNGV
jgi:hypothetical protein